MLKGHLDCVAFLLKHGADVTKAKRTNITPLWDAALKGYNEIAKLLLEYGADYRVMTEEGRSMNCTI